MIYLHLYTHVHYTLFSFTSLTAVPPLPFLVFFPPNGPFFCFHVTWAYCCLLLPLPSPFTPPHLSHSPSLLHTLTHHPSPYSEWLSSRKKMIANDSEDMGRQEPLCADCDNVNLCSHHGNQCGSASKKLKREWPCDSALPCVGMCP